MAKIFVYVVGLERRRDKTYNSVNYNKQLVQLEETIAEYIS